MAKAPLLLHFAAWAQVIPCVTWALSKRRTRAATAVVIGAAVGGLGDIVSRWMGQHLGNNHITTYLDAPIMTVCFLAALREWQLTARERRAFGVGIVLFLLSCVAMVAFLEDIGTFNFGVGPLGSLAILAAGIWTLLRHTSVVEQTPFHRTDWFWVSLGLAVQGGATALASPLGGLLLERGRLDLLDLAWQIRALFVVASYGFIAWGIYLGPAQSRFVAAE